MPSLPISSSSLGRIAAVKAGDGLRLQREPPGWSRENPPPLPHRQDAAPLEQNVLVSPSLESAFRAAHLRRLAGSGSFDRGHAYADSGRGHTGGDRKRGSPRRRAGEPGVSVRLWLDSGEPCFRVPAPWGRIRPRPGGLVMRPRPRPALQAVISCGRLSGHFSDPAPHPTAREGVPGVLRRWRGGPRPRPASMPRRRPRGHSGRPSRPRCGRGRGGPRSG
jgi:hypothetical protein